MANCSICGAPLGGGSKFCPSCGANVAASAAPTQAPTTQTTTAYVPPVATKSKTPLIIGIVVAVVVIVIVLALVLVFIFGGGLSGLSGDESNLVGTWEYGTYGMTVSYVLNSDGSLEIGSMGYTAEAGTWNVEGNKLCWDFSSTYGGTDICYDYTLSGSQLTLSYNGIDMMTLTKK